jgi:hypothetical protein
MCWDKLTTLLSNIACVLELVIIVFLYVFTQIELVIVFHDNDIGVLHQPNFRVLVS